MNTKDDTIAALRQELARKDKELAEYHARELICNHCGKYAHKGDACSRIYCIGKYRAIADKKET